MLPHARPRSHSATQSKILIIDSVVVPATVSRDNPMASSEPLQAVSVTETAGTYKPTTAPNFVPANFGENAKVPLALGVHLMGSFNAYERTLVSPTL